MYYQNLASANQANSVIVSLRTLPSQPTATYIIFYNPSTQSSLENNSLPLPSHRVLQQHAALVTQIELLRDLLQRHHQRRGAGAAGGKRTKEEEAELS